MVGLPLLTFFFFFLRRGRGGVPHLTPNNVTAERLVFLQSEGVGINYFILKILSCPIEVN